MTRLRQITRLRLILYYSDDNPLRVGEGEGGGGRGSEAIAERPFTLLSLGDSDCEGFGHNRDSDC